MCIAIVKPVGVTLSDDLLKTCFENNPDGAGFAYQTESGLRIVKGLFDIDAFLAAYHEHAVNAVNALVHFRITTRGTDGAENTHPFELRHGALIHNGTIMHLGSARGQGKSDTYELSERWYDASLDDMRRFHDVFENYVDNTRVAVMDHSGDTLIFNRRQWADHEGATFSNTSFKPYVPTKYSGSVWGAPSASFRSAFLDDIEYVPTKTATADDGPVEAGYELVDEYAELDFLEAQGAVGDWCWCQNELFVKCADGGVYSDCEAAETIVEWAVQERAIKSIEDLNSAEPFQRQELDELTSTYDHYYGLAITAPKLAA